MISISVVVPVYQEVDSVPKLHQALAAVADRTPGAWELIFVDDGSRDGTWEALCAARRADPRVRAIRLKRNFGQTPAMACGIQTNNGLLESGEKNASAVDVASVSDPRDEDACSFPIKDHAVVTDPISKARLRRVDDSFSKAQRSGGLKPVFDFAEDTALNVARKLQELGFCMLREGARNHERRAFRFTVAAETRPDFREASREARNAGAPAATPSSSSSRVCLSIATPRVWPLTSTNRVIPRCRNGKRRFFAPTSTTRSSTSVFRSGNVISGCLLSRTHLQPQEGVDAGDRYGPHNSSLSRSPQRVKRQGEGEVASGEACDDTP